MRGAIRIFQGRPPLTAIRDTVSGLGRRAWRCGPAIQSVDEASVGRGPMGTPGDTDRSDLAKPIGQRMASSSLAIRA